KRFLPFFQIDWWVCIPEPLSWKSGLGMNVAVLPHFRAVFFAQYLYHMTLSAILVSVSNRMSTSVCAAVATSWWWTSTPTPALSRARTMSERMSWNLSIGGTGKKPPFFRGFFARVRRWLAPPLSPLLHPAALLSDGQAPAIRP